jgi:hypothetical protein
MTNAERASKRGSLSWFVASVLLAAWMGCEPTYKLEAPKAKSSLEVFLTNWSDGKPISSLKSETPPIIGGDEDWQSGLRLAKYEIVETQNDGINLICKVVLTTRRLASDEGSEPIEETKYVVYTVGTNPAITVFRN